MSVTDAIGIAGVIIQTLALLIAGAGIWWQLGKANDDRENGTYDSLDLRFIGFLELCSRYPELEVYNPGSDNWSHLSPKEYRRQLILYQILVSLMERAYILYNEPHALKSNFRRNQWDGWSRYIKDYAETPAFSYAWHIEHIGDDMDRSFLNYMKNEIAVVEYRTP